MGGHKVNDWVSFDDGDLVRTCRVASLQPGRMLVETHRATTERKAISVWVRDDSFRIQNTPAHHRHRTQDRPTAVTAASKVKAGTGKMKVLAALYAAGDHGLLDHDHEALNGLIATSAGKRRLELMREHDAVVDSGRTRKTPSGEDAIVWVLSEIGYGLAAKYARETA